MYLTFNSYLVKEHLPNIHTLHIHQNINTFTKYIYFTYTSTSNFASLCYLLLLNLHFSHILIPPHSMLFNAARSVSDPSQIRYLQYKTQ